MKSWQKILSWFLRLTAALILFQTLYFKFSGAPESIYIFETLEMEPFGRYAAAVAELIAGILLIIPSSVWVGAVITIGIMTAAILSHVGTLGIVVQDDGGLLFILAIIIFLCAAILLYLHRRDLPLIGQRFRPDY